MFFCLFLYIESEWSVTHVLPNIFCVPRKNGGYISLEQHESDYSDICNFIFGWPVHLPTIHIWPDMKKQLYINWWKTITLSPLCLKVCRGCREASSRQASTSSTGGWLHCFFPCFPQLVCLQLLHGLLCQTPTIVIIPPPLDSLQFAIQPINPMFCCLKKILFKRLAM